MASLPSAGRIDASPAAYARQLASYIRDPSTIRVRTIEMFGRGPTVEQARALREEIEAERARESWFNAYMSPKWDGHAKVDYRHPTPPKREKVRFVPKLSGPEWRHSWRALIRAVAADFGLEFEDIVGPRKTGGIVKVRHLVAYLMRERHCSYPSIARRLGRRDHSSAMHSCQVFPRLASEDPDVLAAYRRYSLLVQP